MITTHTNRWDDGAHDSGCCYAREGTPLIPGGIIGTADRFSLIAIMNVVSYRRCSLVALPSDCLHGYADADVDSVAAATLPAFFRSLSPHFYWAGSFLQRLIMRRWSA